MRRVDRGNELYVHTGTDTTSRLIIYQDTGVTGLTGKRDPTFEFASTDLSRASTQKCSPVPASHNLAAKPLLFEVPLSGYESYLGAAALGVIRLFLALVVVADHLRALALEPAGMNINGYYKLGLAAPAAVMFFYLISGFLISFALSHKYGANTSGSIAFYKSRFIRIFSLYWPIFALLSVFNYLDSREAHFSSLGLICGHCHIEE